ncbi:MAG: uroporphyrinogen decarboxylase family protein [Aggregatilineales bacterium]
MPVLPSPHERVLTAIAHQQPDRCPVDFLATNEIWDRLIDHFQPDADSVGASEFFDPKREAILRQLEIDCRVVSYDMFCSPPEHVLEPGAVIEWWEVMSRSTPGRMWRQRLPSGELREIFGRRMHVVENPTGSYEEILHYPLADCTTVDQLKAFQFPDPDWWDWTPLPAVIDHLNRDQHYHIRFRIGSVFEVAWQLRGLSTFLTDLAMEPALPKYIMERLTDIYVENTRRVLDLAADRLDAVYFYDDVATQKSLLISKGMWAEFIRPCHQRIIDVAKSYDVSVMYHSDGALRPLIPELIEMGIDILNPIQANAKGMEPEALKADFGDRLTFHGGIDIVKTLPQGTPSEVRAEVQERIRVLGKDGGYILCSSHHIQSDTPLENVLAMYDLALRAYPQRA